MLQIYLTRHGVNSKSYYSFNYGGCHFVVLDSVTAERSETFAEEQFSWFEKDMAEAKDALHVFVFFHYPHMNNRKYWLRFRANLPAEKTTIFNGHTHTLRFWRDGVIPTYVLAPSAAKVERQNFRMFAHVAVDRGKESIALIPLHKVLPSTYAEYFTLDNFLFVRSWESLVLPANGGTFTLEQVNPFTTPITVAVNWNAPDWKISPGNVRFDVEPGRIVKKAFLLNPQSPLPPRPTASVSYRLQEPVTDWPAETKRQIRLNMYAEMNISRRPDVKVDGNLDDWSGIEAFRVGDATRIFAGRRNWQGTQDSSFALRTATDGHRLFVAVDVMDDQIHHIGGDKPWTNDAIEFSWKTPPSASLDAHKGLKAGRFCLTVPERGAKPSLPQRYIGTRIATQGLQAACKRRDGGYVYEFSIPLSELAIKSPLTAGQRIDIEITVDDRDMSFDKAVITRMNTSGLPRSTVGYMRCTFE